MRIQLRTLTLLYMCAGSASAALFYNLTPIEQLPGSTGAQGRSINNAGQITGYSAFGSGPNITVTAFVYSPGQGITDLGALTGLVDSDGFAINNAGQVVGSYSAGGDPNDVYGKQIRTFVYTPGSGITTLGTFGGNQVYGFAINDLGQVAGLANLPRVTYPEVATHAYLYTPGAGMLDLGTVGGETSSASGINNLGQVVGSAGALGFSGKAFLYTPGQAPRDLGTFGDQPSSANAINDLGQIVGSYDSLGRRAPQAFLYTPGIGAMDIGSLGSYSIAFGMNNRGQAVGFAALDETTVHAFLYSNGVTTDLNNLISASAGVTLYDARGINDLGQIVANSTSGQVYLLTPVPEPASFLLCASACLLALLALFRRSGSKTMCAAGPAI